MAVADLRNQWQHTLLPSLLASDFFTTQHLRKLLLFSEQRHARRSLFPIHGIMGEVRKSLPRSDIHYATNCAKKGKESTYTFTCSFLSRRLPKKWIILLPLRRGAMWLGNGGGERLFTVYPFLFFGVWIMWIYYPYKNKALLPWYITLPHLRRIYTSCLLFGRLCNLLN